MRDKRRLWDNSSEDDPLTGLVNLFDLWMVFSIALLLALVSASKLPGLASSQSATAGEEREATADLPPEKTSPLEHFRVSHEKLTGAGERLGTAYRLKNGEVVYVPD
jgi:hypothetical protein